MIPVAKACNNAASQTTNPALKRRYLSYVTDIWNMFPSFCVCSLDAATILPAYSKNLFGAMTDTRYRELGIIVSKGLTLLVRSSQLAMEEETENMQGDESDGDSESDSESEEEIQESKIRDDDLSEEIVLFNMRLFIDS